MTTLRQIAEDLQHLEDLKHIDGDRITGIAKRLYALCDEMEKMDLVQKWREEVKQWRHFLISNRPEQKRDISATYEKCAAELTTWLAARAGETDAQVAAMVEACVKHDPTIHLDEKGNVPHAYITCDCGWDGRGKTPWDTESWKEHIRSTVTPEAAKKELEKIKAEARYDERVKAKKLAEELLSCLEKFADWANFAHTALEAAARKEQ